MAITIAIMASAPLLPTRGAAFFFGVLDELLVDEPVVKLLPLGAFWLLTALIFNCGSSVPSVPYTATGQLRSLTSTNLPWMAAAFGTPFRISATASDGVDGMLKLVENELPVMSEAEHLGGVYPSAVEFGD